MNLGKFVLEVMEHLPLHVFSPLRRALFRRAQGQVVLV